MILSREALRHATRATSEHSYVTRETSWPKAGRTPTPAAAVTASSRSSLAMRRRAIAARNRRAIQKRVRSRRGMRAGRLSSTDYHRSKLLAPLRSAPVVRPSAPRADKSERAGEQAPRLKRAAGARPISAIISGTHRRHIEDRDRYDMSPESLTFGMSQLQREKRTSSDPPRSVTAGVISLPLR